MIKIYLVLSMIAALLVSGCATTPENENEFDWCYIFNLNEPIGFSIENGSVTGQGLTSDGAGVLIASYGYDRDVYNRVAYITIMRPTGATGDINVKAVAEIFSVSYTTFGTTLPDGVDTAVLETREGAFTEIQVSRDSISVHAETTTGQQISIASVEVRGDGANPFPYNYCDDSTPTNTPPGTPFGSSTPTGTPSPTLSPTPTVTGTLSATPTPSTWTCYWDFSQGQGPWKVADFRTGYDGTGFYALVPSGYTGKKVTHLAWDGTFGTFAGRPTQVTMWFDNYSLGSGSGGDLNGFLVNAAFVSSWAWNTTITSPKVMTFSAPGGSIVDVGIHQVVGYITTPGVDPGGQIRVKAVQIEGTFTQPPSCGAAPTATAAASSTFVPSSTPNSTATREPLWGSCLDFTADAFGFSAVSASYNDLRGFVQSAPQWRIGRGGLATGAKKKIKLTFEAGQSFSGQIRLSDNVANFTSWKTASGNTVIVDFSTGESWVPTSPFWVEFNGNNIPLALRQLCWLDPNPSTATPGPGTGTPLYTRTPLAITPNATVTSYRTPIAVPIVTNTPGSVAFGTPIGGGGGGTPAATSTAGAGGSGTSNVGIGGGGEIADILGFIGQIGSGLGNVAGAYMGQISGQAGALLRGMQNAAPKPIGGLPLCMTNPMAHDICAIYYILDWTLFAPNTPGALIIPLILIIMNFSIAIRVARWGFKLAQRAEDTTGE